MWKVIEIHRLVDLWYENGVEILDENFVKMPFGTAAFKQNVRVV